VAAVLVAGVACRALGLGFVALWCFVAVAVLAALAAPLPYALVSPLFAGVVGWLVDMLPLVGLAGWATVVVRWAWGLVRERRLPYGGRWVWLPAGLAAWTALGVVVIDVSDIKRFILLTAVQFLLSGTLLCVVDALRDTGGRVRLASGLVCFVVLLSAGVLLDWVGVPVQELQDRSVSARAEAAYGVDAFANSLPMVKYVRSRRSGGLELRRALTQLRADNPEIPSFEVFRPKFQAFRTSLVVRFVGSARPVAEELQALDIELLFDNVGLAPANTIPRLRSFPRNSLTYSSTCAAVLPIAFFLAWTQGGWRRRLGWAGAACCLFGAAFSLARGAWAAILVGIVYLAVDGVLSRRRKLQVAAAFVATGVVLTATFVLRYGIDPFTARAEALGSINTRTELYEETLGSLAGVHVILGYGTERPRTESGVSHVLGRYVPEAGTHSTYLNYFFRTGVVGLIAILAIYVVAWLQARARARMASDDVERTFATMLAVSVVTVAAHGVVQNLFTEPIYTLAVGLLLGMAVASGKQASMRPRRARPVT
jgi:O-antigen ligase